MSACLRLVHLNCLQESLPFTGDFLVLHRYHLVEINCAVLLALLERVLLVSEPAGPAAKRLHVIPGAQLIVQGLQLVLNLSIILARSWVLLELARHVVQHIPFDWRNERAHHVLLGSTD